ncbi:hypothetical protein D3C84_1202660 [compost metagenome]
MAAIVWASSGTPVTSCKAAATLSRLASAQAAASFRAAIVVVTVSAWLAAKSRLARKYVLTFKVSAEVVRMRGL